LNGRNFPSAAFIQKMLQAYITLNPRWLMIGIGDMYQDSEREEETISKHIHSENDKTKQDPASTISILQSTLPFEEVSVPASSEVNNQTIQAPQVDSKLSDADQRQTSHVSSLNNITLEAKEIEQILFFYKDKTFSIYRPS
jgi:hypothetical protein